MHNHGGNNMSIIGNPLFIGGGGGVAYITVTYPQGSTCTCSKGGTTLTADDTSGVFMFAVPEGGTWTVSCTDGTDTASKSVVVSEGTIEGGAGGFYEVVLSYISATLNDNEWSVISTVAQAGTGDAYWDVGDRKAVILNGTVGTLSLSNVTLYVYILDFNHADNSVSDNNIIFGGFKSALTGGVDVCLADSSYNSSKSDGTKCFNMNHWGSSSSPYNTNYGGWKGCDLRYDILGSTKSAPSGYGSTPTTSRVGYDAAATAISSPVPNTLMAALPSDFRNVLRLRTHYVDNKGNSSNTDANVTSVVDSIFLLSEFETFGARTSANQYEQNHQTQMAYFKNGNSKVKYKHNATSTAALWWEASPYYSSAYVFCCVYTSGSASDHYSRYSNGLAPAFKI